MSTTYRLITGSGQVFTVGQELFGEFAKLGRENEELVEKCHQFQQQVQDADADFWRIRKLNDELAQQNTELRKLLREACWWIDNWDVARDCPSTFLNRPEVKQILEERE